MYRSSELGRMPQYLIDITSPTELYINLSCEKVDVHLGMSIFRYKNRVPHGSQPDETIIIHTSTFTGSIVILFIFLYYKL